MHHAIRLQVHTFLLDKYLQEHILLMAVSLTGVVHRQVRALLRPRCNYHAERILLLTDSLTEVVRRQVRTLHRPRCIYYAEQVLLMQSP